jgi:hypothetical protein
MTRNIEKSSITLIKQMQIDWIATHGRTGLAHFFNGALSEDIVNHAIKPINNFRI